MSENLIRATLVKGSNGAHVSGGQRGGLRVGSEELDERETTEGMISAEMVCPAPMIK